MHIGAPTGADTLYTEAATVGLPSGLGSFTLPMQKLVGRRRGAYVQYQPSVTISTETALMQWIERHTSR